MKHFNIALDGPSGTGKSSTAKQIAKKLGLRYVDTGAMYRTIGLFIDRAGVDPDDAEAVGAALAGLKIDVKYTDAAQLMYINGEDVTPFIRTEKISSYASKVSRHICVREFLLNLQRTVAAENDVVMDGRDIGTVILPDADVKIFLFASAETRADRRYKELTEKGENAKYEDVLADIIARDKRDAERDISPCVPAADAIMLDNSNLTLEQTVEFIADKADEKRK